MNDDSKTGPGPIDLAEIKRRWADADEYSGTMRWNPIVADLIAEVERLRTLCPHDLLLADLHAMRGVYGEDEEAHYCEGAKDGIDAAIALVKLRTGRTEPVRS